ncbi:MAG: DUF6508 domain-containing protein, partial [Steroidobacteraceae bacterium]|nr:DUF6508 domain-containing protein [Steroidobacteraceae bacterium]
GGLAHMQEDSRVKSSRPTQRDIDALVAFLPRLYADGVDPIRDWGGGEKQADGAYVMPWPEYEDVVKEFFEAAGQDCWIDFKYDPIEAGRMLEDEALVRRASLDDIKTMLTYCVRGERFSEGHWAAMIEAGHVRRLLERLEELRGD